MDADTLLTIFLVIISAEFIFGKFLEWLNYKSLKKKMPEALSGIYSEEKYLKSVVYNRVNARFSFLVSTLSFILIFLLVSTGFFGFLDSFLRNYINNEILVSLAFFGILFIASDLLSTPFDLYDTFVIEEKFGFNKTTPGTYLADKLKGYLLTILIGGGLLFLLLILIRTMGSDFWMYFWLAFAVFTLVMNMFYTTLIMPLFNTITPLTDGDLKDRIRTYCETVKFPLDNIFIIDGSRRSTKANAFFSGLGKKKKIILYDTLINNHAPEEIVAVIAHEVGHFRKKHIFWGYINGLVQTGIILYIMALMVFSPELSEAFGAGQAGLHLNLLAFGILISPLNHVTGVLMNIFSRKNEFQADSFAALTYKSQPLQDALIKLSVDNLGHLTPHPFFVFVNYSHPPLLYRLEALKKYN